jgi:hypothetical protein
MFPDLFGQFFPGHLPEGQRLSIEIETPPKLDECPLAPERSYRASQVWDRNVAGHRSP